MQGSVSDLRSTSDELEYVCNPNIYRDQVFVVTKTTK